MTLKYFYSIAVASVLFASGCKKQDEFLDVKSNNADVTPSTLKDFQALLDNNTVINTGYPIYGLVSTDNFFVTDATYNSLTVPAGPSYIWAADILQGVTFPDWASPYKTVEYTNVVLDGVKTLPTDSASGAIRGAALFYRAFAFYNLAAEFCKPYDKSSAATDPGIPLRESSDINIVSTRSTVQQTYDRIISDLKTAVDLLPIKPLVTTRPSRAAAYALLAKVYLSMEDYANALVQANNMLQQKSDLMDYNNTSLVTVAANLPFPAKPDNNPEMLLFAETASNGIVWPRGSGIVDSVLFATYDVNDLRKTTLYKLNGVLPQFKGSYDCTSGNLNFAGIATNEIYLIRSECNARQGNIAASLSDLNLLLKNRYKTGTFSNLTLTNADSVLSKVLLERRKELPFNGLARWEDLRRLNKDTRFAVALKRKINGNLYTLAPNDINYVLPIPDAEIQLTGVQQNIRH